MTESVPDFIVEWDDAKAASNLRKHRVSFITAASIFTNHLLEHVDDREDYGELRTIALGRVESEIFRVVYTTREPNIIRIISAQKATAHERELYYEQIFSSGNSGDPGSRRR